MKYLITRAKVILHAGREDSCEQPAGLPREGQVLHHRWRCGRPFCGFSGGENIKKGQLCPIAPARVGPVGNIAELAVSSRSCHCLLFAGLSFNLFNPHGRKQDERVLRARCMPELHRLCPAPPRPVHFFLIATVQFL